MAILWVTFEYVFIGSSRSIPIVKSIKIHQNEFKENNVTTVTHQQIPFLLVHRTDEQVSQLTDSGKYLRSIKPKYFIAIAIGTHYGCAMVKKSEGILKESCSDALYDYSGYALNTESEALKVPEMTYNEHTQFFNLTLK